MVEINRVWLNVDTDTNKITLFGRPRVSIRVDEYIWSLIEEHIVKPHMPPADGAELEQWFGGQDGVASILNSLKMFEQD